MQPSNVIYTQLLNYKAPRFEEFPEIDLYMDQMVELLNTWLAPLYFDQSKPCLTASMINNYVKNSIVEPPVKKRYTRYHLAYLYVVMVLKQCFSLQEISTLITIYRTVQTSNRTAGHFNTFASVFENMLHQVMKTSEVNFSNIEDPNWQQHLMINSLQAVCCKIFSVYQIHVFLEAKEPAKSSVKKTASNQ
ncbi:DUF1836 domain-containing protein [Erysipelotrichaceae bacterium RD49]|nr:DUF1836 domain-containing protein [Erysipelotrichaceae bacterium RD49]